MNPRLMITTLLASLSLILAGGCSSSKEERKMERPSAAISAMNEASEVDQPTSIRTKSLRDQVDFAALEFDQGEAKLSDMDRRHLNELAIKMTGAGKIVDDIKILTWSDREVVADEDATNTEIILARQRAESIKRYMERTLPAEEDIDFYNMAENPKRYTEYMNRKGIPVKEAFNEQGKVGSPEGRALVIIEYQSGPMPSTL